MEKIKRNHLQKKTSNSYNYGETTPKFNDDTKINSLKDVLEDIKNVNKMSILNCNILPQYKRKEKREKTSIPIYPKFNLNKNVLDDRNKVEVEKKEIAEFINNKKIYLNKSKVKEESDDDYFEKDFYEEMSKKFDDAKYSKKEKQKKPTLQQKKKILQTQIPKRKLNENNIISDYKSRNIKSEKNILKKERKVFWIKPEIEESQTVYNNPIEKYQESKEIELDSSKVQNHFRFLSIEKSDFQIKNKIVTPKLELPLISTSIPLKKKKKRYFPLCFC